MTPTPKDNAANRDAIEPSVGFSTVPMWFIVIFAGLFYWSQLYLNGHAGGFDKQVYAPFHTFEEVASSNPHNAAEEQAIMGAEIFAKTCAACHQPTGEGKPGVAPPLVGSEWVLAAGPNRIAHIVLNGLTGVINVKGQDFNLTMPPWKDNFNDQQIAAVLTYVRNNWGNKASAVHPDIVTAARKETHPGPESSSELLQMPVQ